MNIVKVLTIAVGLIASSTAVIENDSQQKQKHLRKKPVGALIQSASSSSSSSIPAALRSFLSWPANTFNIDDERHHPLGSNYILQQQLDDTNAKNKDNVLFSLKLSTRNSNMIRNRRRLHRHFSSVNEDEKRLKEERKVAMETYNLDISPAIESLEQNAAAATTNARFETEHYFPESMEDQQQQEEDNTTDVDEIELYFPSSTTTTTKNEENSHEDNHDNEAHDAHDSHDDAHDMVVHVTYEDICEYLLFL